MTAEEDEVGDPELTEGEDQDQDENDPGRLHATCVSINGKGALFIGASGSGKSAAALELVSRGAQLVSDDQVLVRRDRDQIIASCPDGFEGWIEARGIGILRVPFARDIPVTVVVDMDQTELHRLPQGRKHEILGLPLDLVLGRDNWGLISGVWSLLHGGRVD